MPLRGLIGLVQVTGFSAGRGGVFEMKADQGLIELEDVVLESRLDAHDVAVADVVALAVDPDDSPNL